MIPLDLDPRTLRWLADDFERESERCELYARRYGRQYGGSRSVWALRARSHRNQAKRLRGIATRIENRRRA